MAASQEEQLREVVQLRRAKQFETALQACDEAILKFGGSADLYCERARILARLREFHEASLEMTRVIALGAATLEYYFDRGRWSMKAGNYEQAVGDFTQVLKSRSEPEGEFYQGITQLYRSFCFLRLGRAEDALRDALECDDDGSVWVANEVVDRETLVNEARRKVVRVAKSAGAAGDDKEPTRKRG